MNEFLKEEGKRFLQIFYSYTRIVPTGLFLITYFWIFYIGIKTNNPYAWAFSSGFVLLLLALAPHLLLPYLLSRKTLKFHWALVIYGVFSVIFFSLLIQLLRKTDSMPNDYVLFIFIGFSILSYFAFFRPYLRIKSGREFENLLKASKKTDIMKWNQESK